MMLTGGCGVCECDLLLLPLLLALAVHRLVRLAGSPAACAWRKRTTHARRRSPVWRAALRRDSGGNERGGSK
jgi:hypothetical protein